MDGAGVNRIQSFCGFLEFVMFTRLLNYLFIFVYEPEKYVKLKCN